MKITGYQGMIAKGMALLLSLLVLVEVNYPQLGPQSQLTLFAALGITYCFLIKPFKGESVWLKWINWSLILLTLLVFGYVFIQSEPFFKSWWIDSQSLGHRAGSESQMDLVIGALGVLLVLEAARRSVGWSLPLLALVFLMYALLGRYMPVFPHRGYGWERIVGQTFLHSQGVFGVALRVMFTYVFLFVLFGALLESTGATHYVVGFTRRIFGKRPESPALVAVLSSGLMGSLSGSAVANTASTGTFTIPMMRGSGFRAQEAAGIEAAASSGGALMPPVMGAGAYMMLELVDPPVTYWQIVRAAFLPALLYYGAILLLVFLNRHQLKPANTQNLEPAEKGNPFAGFLFVAGLAVLLATLSLGYTAFRAATVALVAALVLSVFHPKTRLTCKGFLVMLQKTAAGAVPLIAATACVGMIIGVVTLTGLGAKFPAMLLPLAKQNLLAALLLIMIATIILGMGLPSAVCYLLMATFVGPVLGSLSIAPLAAHLFIFYFGMMSMVTPPVALAGYTAATIAEAPIIATSFQAFRYALAGFLLPFFFIFRPELLFLTSEPGTQANWISALLAFAWAGVGLIPLCICLAGAAWRPICIWQRFVFGLCAIFILLPYPGLSWMAAAGMTATFVLLLFLRLRPAAAH